MQVERVLDDARGRDSDPEHVLLGGQIGRLRDTVQIRQIARQERREKHRGIIKVGNIYRTSIHDYFPS